MPQCGWRERRLREAPMLTALPERLPPGKPLDNGVTSFGEGAPGLVSARWSRSWPPPIEPSVLNELASVDDASSPSLEGVGGVSAGPPQLAGTTSSGNGGQREACRHHRSKGASQIPLFSIGTCVFLLSCAPFAVRATATCTER